MDDKILETCRNSFATHKAELIQNTERFLIVDWRQENGNSAYYVNYIVDKKRGSLIVSGDLGDSIATWYNPIEPAKLKGYINDIGYYISKFCASSDCYYVETENIVADIKDNVELEDDSVLIDMEMYSIDEFWERVEDEVESSIYDNKFIPSFILTNILEQAGCCDTYLWLYECGKRIHTRVYLWAVGFQMACKQLGI